MKLEWELLRFKIAKAYLKIMDMDWINIGPNLGALSMEIINLHSILS